MTTETKQDRRDSGVAVLLGAALTTLVVGLLGTLLGGLTGGRPAAYGALVGAAIAFVVFCLGAFVVNAVAGLVPSAALLVALMTYTLQVLLLALVFVGLSDSGLMDGTLDARWLAGMIIAGTFVWTGAQLLLTTRRRIPVYDLVQGTEGSER